MFPTGALLGKAEITCREPSFSAFGQAPALRNPLRVSFAAQGMDSGNGQAKLYLAP